MGAVIARLLLSGGNSSRNVFVVTGQTPLRDDGGKCTADQVRYRYENTMDVCDLFPMQRPTKVDQNGLVGWQKTEEA